MQPVQIQSKLTSPLFKQTNNIKVLKKEESNRWNYNHLGSKKEAEINDKAKIKIEINDK